MTAITDNQRAALAALRDKQAIADNLANHARGIDRADAGLLASVYHPDARVDYGFFNGPAAELVALLVPMQRRSPVTLHRPANVWIKVRGDLAISESYVIAYAESHTDQGPVQSLVGGRYLDRHAWRDGAWRISHRSYVLDWNINRPSTASYAEATLASGHFVPLGGHGARDPGNLFLAIQSADFRAATSEGNTMTERPITDADIDALLSRETLKELLLAYCRGVDRGDEALLASPFHDDATVITGAFNGPARDFAPQILRTVAETSRRVFHSVNNCWFDIDGDRAVGESYVIAVQTVPGPEGDLDILVGGRYLDRFERRAGVWKIAQHTFVMDWNMTQPCTAVMDEGMFGEMVQGRRDGSDPVHGFWNSLP
jgi:hypothetical protein